MPAAVNVRVAGPVVVMEIGLAVVHGPYAACDTSATLWLPVAKLKTATRKILINQTVSNFL